MVIEDRDLLQVSIEPDNCDDTIHVRLFSRHFNEWRGGIRLAAFEAPPAREATNITLAAFGPLFRAYANMPFGLGVLVPLLAATMDRLLPELRSRLMQSSAYYQSRRLTRLVPADNAPITNAFVQGDVALRHMDRVEAAFRMARESGDLVSLEQGRVVRRPAEEHRFLDPDWFRGGPPRAVTATETRIRAAMEAAWDPATIRREMEQVIMYGQATHSRRSGWTAEALARAKETLIHCLNEVQRAEFQRSNFFTVVAQDGQMYKITANENFNVHREGTSYCCVPAEEVCVYDKMLASKLWLEADFQRFMRIANRRDTLGRFYPGREEGDVYRRGRMTYTGLRLQRPHYHANLNTIA